MKLWKSGKPVFYRKPPLTNMAAGKATVVTGDHVILVIFDA
jgi:hypothetical protein